LALATSITTAQTCAALFVRRFEESRRAAEPLVRVRLGPKSNIDAVGAKITYRSGDFQRHRFLVGAGGFLCGHDPRVVLGLGQRTKLDWIEVKWPAPSGKVERFVNPPVDRYNTIVEGEGPWV
jgi:hypothetical protein